MVVSPGALPDYAAESRSQYFLNTLNFLLMETTDIKLTIKNVPLHIVETGKAISEILATSMVNRVVKLSNEVEFDYPKLQAFNNSYFANIMAMIIAAQTYFEGIELPEDLNKEPNENS